MAQEGNKAATKAKEPRQGNGTHSKFPGEGSVGQSKQGVPQEVSWAGEII